MRKYTLPAPLQKLAESQLAEVHSWFGRQTYDQMLVTLSDRFAVSMSRSQLARYFKRFAEAHLFNGTLQDALTPAHLVAIKNGEPIPDAISREELKQKGLRLIRRPGLTVAGLKLVADVLTYEERAAMKQREQDIALFHEDNRARYHEFRERLSAREHSKKLKQQKPGA
jgi:hypothetical protein